MELHCFPRVECRNGSRSRRGRGGAPLPLPPPSSSSSFPPVSGQTRKIYFLSEWERREPGGGGANRGIIPPTHEYQERLTNYRVKYCNLLMGEMRDSGKETKAPAGPSFSTTSFVFTFLQPPRASLLAASPLAPFPPLPVHRPTVLYLLTQLKKQSVERPRSAFYHADAANRL